ncbi:hypothetical protein [Kibdelosporangium phytohabitans]|uniref:Uncharacterized protein n=1 Tax=Kibdelosporangium phytohabitans TaxID=860235 RepID=A0A0N9I2W8_9PSEU|nr:hypothetical protein [Kibdelosporangium phytohabitans]ALG12113.1 hypothetical protein AOZ06_39290 [Kibdelosporangium phytohabitans]MBE1463612.1 hypothetical protein [Kibdelosporangium phytohabitans]
MSPTPFKSASTTDDAWRNARLTTAARLVPGLTVDDVEDYASVSVEPARTGMPDEEFFSAPAHACTR